MKKLFFTGFLIAAVFFALPGFAPAQQEQATKTISISSIGTAKAKPDVTPLRLCGRRGGVQSQSQGMYQAGS